MVFDFESNQTIDWINTNCSSKKKFVTNFIRCFSFIRCYHFGKIFPFDTFSENLLSGDYLLLKKRAKQLFYDGENNKIIDDVINKYEYTDQGKLYFWLTKGILKNAVIYLIQGSETLCFIARDIEKIKPNLHVVDKLFNSGTPVIFHLNVPVQDFMIKNISIVYEIIRTNEVNDISTNENLDYGLYIKKSVSNRNIFMIEKLKIEDLLIIAEDQGLDIPFK